MNANESNRRNSYESDDELATVYERPTSEQAKDRLNNADSATLNGWDVTLDDDDELETDDKNESESDSLDLDEDELERAKEDVAYVDALLNGDDPEDEGVATDGGVDTRAREDESDEIEHFDDIESLDQANQAAIEQGMALRIQPMAPNPTQYYFVDGSDWKRQLAGHKISSSVRVEHVRTTVKKAIPENDHAGGGGVKAVAPETVETCPEPEKDDGEDEMLIECRECRTAGPISQMIEKEHIPRNEDGIALEIRRRFFCSRGCAQAGQIIMTDGGVQVYLNEFEDESADDEIDCPNGRGDCPGKLSELDALRTELGEQCSGCFGASLFPNGEPEEVEVE